MPYGDVKVERSGGKIVIVVDPPTIGELSARGRAENLVSPSEWICYEDVDGRLSIKLTVCRPIERRALINKR